MVGKTSKKRKFAGLQGEAPTAPQPASISALFLSSALGSLRSARLTPICFSSLTAKMAVGKF